MRNENRSNRFFGPNVDHFINDIDARMFLNDPFKLITENNYTIDVPILMGITSNEGAYVDGKMMTVKYQGQVKWWFLTIKIWNNVPVDLAVQTDSETVFDVYASSST